MPRAIPTFRPKWWPKRAERRRDQGRETEYRQQPWRLADKRFYSSDVWLRLREIKLSENPTCEECRKIGRTTLATEVHHVLDRLSHQDSSLDLANLMSLCKRCHNSMRKTSSSSILGT